MTGLVKWSAARKFGAFVVGLVLFGGAFANNAPAAAAATRQTPPPAAGPRKALAGHKGGKLSPRLLALSRHPRARALDGVDGSGETVGILSDSFDTAIGAPTRAATDVATGDLPGVGNPCGHNTPVVVQSDFSGGGQADEGRAMAQLVHDLAPGAHLAFATAFNGDLDFANQITRL